MDPGAVSFQIRNSLFVGNSSPYSGAMRIDGLAGYFTPLVINCTFSSNTTEAVRYKRDCGPEFRNCLLWGDGGSGKELVEDGTLPDPVVNYCDVEGGSPVSGTSNINANPLFVSPVVGTWLSVGSYNATTRQTTLTGNGVSWTANAYRGLTVNPDVTNRLQFVIASNGTDTVSVWGDPALTGAQAGDTFRINDYALSATNSPCYNAGTSSGAPASDLLGVARPQDGFYDMGAYELVYTPPVPFTGTIYRFK
jgi:hypothetical protein